MYCKAIKLVFFICVLNAGTAFSQNTPSRQKATNNTAITTFYNKWLKKLNLDKLLIADEVLVHQTPVAPGLGKDYILVLKPGSNYKKPADMAKAWAYIKDGFEEKGIDLPLLLFNKFADAESLPPADISVEIQTDSPDIFSLRVNFNKGVVITENNSSIRGGDIAVDYNFDAPPLTTILCRTYTLKSPVADLKAYNDKWQAFFFSRKHKTGEKIQIETPLFEPGVVRFIAGNIFKDVTGEDYYEKIVLEIVLMHSKQQQPQINYSASVYYAATPGSKTPSAYAYRDIAEEPDFTKNIADFKVNLETEFQSIFNVRP